MMSSSIFKKSRSSSIFKFFEVNFHFQIFWGQLPFSKTLRSSSILLVHTLCLGQIKCCTDEVHTCTVKPVCYNCTLLGVNLAFVLLTNHRRASIYMLRCDWSISHHHPPDLELNHSMLTTSVPSGKETW